MRYATRTMLALVSAVLLLAAGLAAQKTDSAQALLRAAMDKAVVDGDLNGAIKQYQTIVDTFKTDRAVVATALVRMAECYQKLGDNESRKIYERVMREFTDQAESVAVARARLAALASASPSAFGQTARQVWTGADVIRSIYGSPSPDGRYVSFTNPGTGDLAVRDLREGASRRLTHNEGPFEGYVSSSVFSPDGHQVAYAWNTRDLKIDLRILPLTGGEATQPRIVHRNEETSVIRPFAWTPEGKQLVVLRTLNDRTNQIAMVSVQDGSVRVLKSLTWQYATLSLSPDGHYIAYDVPAGDNTSARDIFLLAADGSREIKAVDSPADDSFPLWSPDGSRILFLSTRTGNTSLWTVPIEGGTPKGPAELVKADIGRIRPLGMTRVGTLYYLISGLSRTNVYIAELDAALKTTKAPVLATERFINSNGQPSWSPDGQYLAYHSSRGTRTDGSRATVLVVRTLKTGEERDVSPPVVWSTGNFVPPPKWFPDGRSVLLCGFGDSPGQGSKYYRVDLASGNADLLHVIKSNGQAGGLGSNALSPDGKTIFYIDRGSNEPNTVERQLIRFDVDSRRETVLKSGPLFTSLAVSPDGTQLAYVQQYPPAQGSSLQVMPAAGGEPREVFRDALWGDSTIYNALAWSPDQRYLLFVRTGENASNVLWRVPVAGGEPEQIGISMTGQLMYPQVHPDGRRMTFGVFETGASEVWALENFLPTANAAR